MIVFFSNICSCKRFRNNYFGSMLEKLQQALEKKYKLRETKWLFVSGFDKDGKLQYSQGIVETDKPLDELLGTMFTKFIDPVKDTKVITLDVVTTLFEETNITKIPTTQPKLYGFAIVDDAGHTWVILPWTKGVADAKHALFLIKQKYGVNGKVKIFVFTTDRILVTS